MELLLAHILAGKGWDSDQVTLHGPQLGVANTGIREQQKSAGLHSALVQAGIAQLLFLGPGSAKQLWHIGFIAKHLSSA